jgi:hypothetical protein
MTYEKIFDLKFRKGYSTTELMQRFPAEAEKVREIALLEIPNALLRKTVPQGALRERILLLKRRFLRELS